MNTKNTQIIFRLSQTEKKQLKDLAKEHHLSMTSFIKLKTLTTKY